MNGKREKSTCASMGHLLNWRMGKMMVRLHEGEDPKKRGHIQSTTHIYKIAIMGYRITKMPLLGLKCGPFT